MANPNPDWVNSVMSAAMTAVREENNTLNTLLQTTRETFRPSRTLSRRGRPRNPWWKPKRHIFLLRRANADFFPANNEANFLTRNGLGRPAVECVLNRNWPMNRVEQYICSLYPAIPLDLVGFKLAKLDKNKKVHIIQATEVADLEHQINNGTLVVIPNRDLPINEAVQEPPVIVQPSTSGASDTVNTVNNREHQQLQLPSQENVMPSTSHTTVNSQEHMQLQLPSQENIIPSTSGTNIFMDLDEAFQPYDEDGFPDGTTGIEIIVDRTVQQFSGHAMELEFPVASSLEIADICINRDNCVEEMLAIYADPHVVDKHLKVTFKNESGEDFGGLTKEAFTIFWKAIEPDYFHGEDAIVPHLPLHLVRKLKSNFEIMGRILTHMAILTKSVPNKIARCIYVLLADAERHIENTLIMEDFMLFVTVPERRLLQKALKSYESLTPNDLHMLESLYNAHSFYELPNSIEIKEQVVTIATEILVSKPKSFISAMRNGIPLRLMETFWSNVNPETITNFLISQKPTAVKVLQCIRTTNEDITNDQDTVLYYVKNYVSSLDSEKLMQFLLFITGSIHMPDHINICFNNNIGLCRRPIAHTCTNLLELSVAYSSFQEFKREMNAYLASEFSFQYSQI